MLDHMTFRLRDPGSTRAFREQALAPLGYRPDDCGTLVPDPDGNWVEAVGHGAA